MPKGPISANSGPMDRFVTESKSVGGDTTRMNKKSDLGNKTGEISGDSSGKGKDTNSGVLLLGATLHITTAPVRIGQA